MLDPVQATVDLQLDEAASPMTVVYDRPKSPQLVDCVAYDSTQQPAPDMEPCVAYATSPWTWYHSSSVYHAY